MTALPLGVLRFPEWELYADVFAGLELRNTFDRKSQRGKTQAMPDQDEPEKDTSTK